MRALLRFAKRAGYSGLPDEIADAGVPAHAGSTFISIITTDGNKTLTRSALRVGPPYDRLYHTLLNAIRAGLTCVAPGDCPPNVSE